METTNRLRRIGAKPAAMALAALALAGAGTLATAPKADAIQCPPGTVALGILCIRSSTPATAPPQTTTTTAAPLLNLPPVTLPPLVPPPPAGSISAPDAARRLLDLANAERARAGLGALASRGDVEAIALAHSERMAKTGDIFHSDSFFGATVKNLLNVVARGENVAYNGDIEAAHARLMASAGHRANILDGKFSVAGFGVVRAADGRYFITQNFIQPAGAPRSVAPVAPAAPKAAPRPAATKTAAAPAAVAAPVTTAAPVVVAEPPTTVPATTTPPDTTPTLSLADASPTVIAATGTPRGGPRLAVAIVAMALLAVVSLGCWLVPGRRS